MAYVQSTSGGTALAANVSTLALSFANAIGSTGAPGTCLVADILWNGTGTATVTDSRGNTWTQIFTFTDGVGDHWSSWYAPNAAAGATTVTVSGSALFAEISLAIHEYTQILTVGALDTYGTVHGAPMISPGYNTSYSLELVHAFCGNQPGAGGGFNGTPIPYLFSAREDVEGSAGCRIRTFDRQLTAAFPANQTVNFGNTIPHVTQPPICGAVFGLRCIPSPTSRAQVGFSWLMINEPTIGLTDQTRYLYLGKASHSISSTLRQRGQAEVPLMIRAGNPYMPTEGTQVYLYDQNVADGYLVFAGTIEQITIKWLGKNGDKVVTLSCVSFRKAFSTLLVPPQAFYAQTAASIFTSLLATVANGVPVVAGNISAPFVINALTISWDRLDDIFDQIATAAGCIWDIDLSTLTVYLQPPSTTPSPYALTSSQVMWSSNEWNVNSQDYRNRQILRISPGAFGDSYEIFPVSNGSLNQSFTLSRAIQNITAAWLTKSTENFATLTFSANPSPGDTVTITYPQTGSIYNWAPNAPYYTGQGIVDPAGHIQVCSVGNAQGSTVTAFSGSSQPTWNDTGGTTSDGAIVWQDEGLSGPGGLGAYVYTFVNTLLGYSGTPAVPYNAQFGQVLIGKTVGQTTQNLADAINSNQLTQGQTFSWPTWENPIINADQAGGSTVTVRNKAAGAGYVASLSETSGALSWSAAQTSGGSTQGAQVLQTAQNGSSNSANVYFTPGSAIVGFASIPAGASLSGSGWQLAIQYQRAGGDCIICEDTAAVNLRASIENGTGKYQVIASDSSNTSTTSGLQQCQAALAAFSTIPVSFSFKTRVPGLVPGQYLDITVSDIPTGIAALINGQYLIQEVRISFIPLQTPGGTSRWMDGPTVPGGGHYEYTVTVINISQIFSWLEFWKQMGSGGSGGGGTVSITSSPLIQPSTPVLSVGQDVLVPDNGVVTPDLALGDSFVVTLNNWLTTSAAITSSAASMTVTALPSGVSPANCPFNCILDPGLSMQEQVTVTAMSGTGNKTWAITRAQWGTTAQAHSAGFNIIEQFTIAIPAFTNGSVIPSLSFTLYLINPSSTPLPTGAPLPNFTNGAGGFASDTALRVQNQPISFSGTASTQTSIIFTANTSLVWIVDTGSSGGALS